MHYNITWLYMEMFSYIGGIAVVKAIYSEIAKDV